MTVPRLLLIAGLALLIYLLGTRSGRHHSTRLRDSAREAWHSPESKKARSKLQKLAKRNAKKIDKGVHHADH